MLATLRYIRLPSALHPSGRQGAHGRSGTCRMTRRRVLILVAMLLIILLLTLRSWLHVLHDEQAIFGNNRHDNSHPELPVVTDWARDAFMDAAMSAAAETDFDPAPITQICNEVPWVPDVVFECAHVNGGIGNVKMQILACVRYALDAGAGILLPRIYLRDASNLGDLDHAGTTWMAYLFDQDVFLQRLHASCPQMPIFPDREALARDGRNVSVKPPVQPWSASHFPGTTVTSVRDFVGDLHRASPKGDVTLIPFGVVTSYYPVCTDPSPFVISFGKLLVSPPTIRHLTASALWALHSNHSLTIDPRLPVAATLPDQPDSGYLGIHLRTSNDVFASWPAFDEQRAYYLRRMADPTHGAHGFRTLYVASGNATSVALFADAVRATRPDVRVLTKTDLFTPEEKEEIAGMTWDQAALLDLALLTRAGFFLGMGDSSFSWQVAHRRTVALKLRNGGGGVCGVRKGVWTGYVYGCAVCDALSDVLGTHPFGFETNMWP